MSHPVPGSSFLEPSPDKMMIKVYIDDFQKIFTTTLGEFYRWAGPFGVIIVIEKC
jgi:hypothetical protein